ANRYLRRGDGGLDQDVPRHDLRRLRALHLDYVEAELGAHDVGDGPRPKPKRDVLELLDHHAAAEPAQRAALLPRDAVRRVLLRDVGKGGPATLPQRHYEGLRQLQRPGARRRVWFRHDHDLAERDGRRSFGLLRAVRLPERPHLGVRRRNRPQLPLLLQPLDQPLLQDRATLLVGEPTTPFLLGHEPGRAQLRLELRGRRELLAHVLNSLLDRVLHFLVRHLDGGVPLRLLHQQLLVHHLREDLVPRGVPPRGVLRDLGALRLRQDELLFHLRREDRLRADDRHDAVHRAVGRRPALRRHARRRGRQGGKRRHEEGQDARTHVNAAPAGRRSPPRRAAGQAPVSDLWVGPPAPSYPRPGWPARSPPRARFPLRSPTKAAPGAARRPGTAGRGRTARCPG